MYKSNNSRSTDGSSVAGVNAWLSGGNSHLETSVSVSPLENVQQDTVGAEKSRNISEYLVALNNYRIIFINVIWCGGRNKRERNNVSNKGTL